MDVIFLALGELLLLLLLLRDNRDSLNAPTAVSQEEVILVALRQEGAVVSPGPRDAQPTATLPAVGGRILLFKHNWEKIFPDRWVSNVVQHGYCIEFAVTPPVKGLLRITPVPSDQNKRRV